MSESVKPSSTYEHTLYIAAAVAANAQFLRFQADNQAVPGDLAAAASLAFDSASQMGRRIPEATRITGVPLMLEITDDTLVRVTTGDHEVVRGRLEDVETFRQMDIAERAWMREELAHVGRCSLDTDDDGPAYVVEVA